MTFDVTQKLIKSYLVSGEMTSGSEIGLRIDRSLTQDATGTMVMLELEAMKLDRVKIELSVQYKDIRVKNSSSDRTFTVTHSLSPRQREIILAGGLINFYKLQQQPLTV